MEELVVSENEKSNQVTTGNENPSCFTVMWNFIVRQLTTLYRALLAICNFFCKCTEPRQQQYDKVSTQDPVTVKEKDYPKVRKDEFNYLFVGLDSAGISSVAQTAFNIPTQGKPGKDLKITEYSNSFEDVSCPIQYKIIDVPGLCKGDHINQDAELIIALNTHLKASIPNQQPNAVTIVSRFDHNRFEGEGSEFSKMLRALSHSCSHWAANDLSNVLLVLTHASKVTENVEQRVAKFQETFHQIFPPKGQLVRVALIDKDIDSEELVTILRKDLEQLSPQVVMDLLSQPFSIKEFSIEALLPPTRREINELNLDLLQSVSFHQLPPPRSESEDEMDTVFIPYKFPQSSTPINPDKRSFLLPETKVLMGDGFTQYPVYALKAGDKVLDKDFSSVVLASVTPVQVQIKNPSISNYGVHFALASETLGAKAKPIVWSLSTSKSPSPKLIKAVLDFPSFYENLSEKIITFYKLELHNVNKPKGSFIADGVVVYETVP